MWDHRQGKRHLARKAVLRGDEPPLQFTQLSTRVWCRWRRGSRRGPSGSLLHLCELPIHLFQLHHQVVRKRLDLDAAALQQALPLATNERVRVQHSD
jgi:hypothetical protein